MHKTIVSVVRCENYTPENVRTAVAEALRLAELDEIMTAGTKVLLKPNLLSPRPPADAVTTHPTLVQALGEIAVNKNCSVSVGDSPPFAGQNVTKYARLCDVTGMTKASARLGIPIVRFEEEVVSVSNPEGRFYRNFEIAKTVIDSDLIVNIPKLKTHGLTAFSGAVKNFFGCVPGVRKGLFHVQAQTSDDRVAFAQMLVDLLGVMSRSVSIMDAVVAMEGEGPNSGTPRQIGLIMASSDPVALDATACRIVGIDPLSVHTTRLAWEQGIGTANSENIDVRGESIDLVRIHGFKQSSGADQWARVPGPIRNMLRNQLVAVPRVKDADCVGCRDCATACPVGAITPGKPASIDLTKCIRCYCCHEVCNFSAISLRRGWIGNLLNRGG